MNPPISRVALIVRPQSPELAGACEQVIEQFQSHGIEVCALESSVKALGLDPSLICAQNELRAKAQALVSLGGDGTLISAVRQSIASGSIASGDVASERGAKHIASQSAANRLPVLGINMGRLGFLTAITPEQLDSFIPLLQRGEYALDSHHLLQGRLDSAKSSTKDSPNSSNSPESSAPFYVLNEILITKKDIAGMIKITASMNEEHFHTYRADGLIIATPTGSSAYNISAGGSLVHPKCRVILLTPVCAHSLHQRPMIVGDDFCLHFCVEEDAMIMLDGQERAELRKGDRLVVSGAFPIELIQHPKRSYFGVLEEKFGLGG